MSKRDVVVLGACDRQFGNIWRCTGRDRAAELAGTVMQEAIKRSGVDPKSINYVTVGNTIPTESRFAYVARVASIQAGLRWTRSRCRSIASVRRACRGL